MGVGAALIYRCAENPYVLATGASYVILLWGLMIDLLSDRRFFYSDMTLYFLVSAFAFVLILATVYLQKVKMLEKEARLSREKLE